MTRLRSPAQRAPQTLEEATAIAGRFATLDAMAASIEASRQRMLVKINGDADTSIAPIVAEMKDIVKRLKPWFAGNYDELTKGERKSIEIGGCHVGYRVSPPKVTFEGTDADGLAALLESGLDDLVRVVRSIDKPAVLKALEGEDASSVTALGFTIAQPELFFVDRLQPKPDPVADVPDGAGGAVS